MSRQHGPTRRAPTTAHTPRPLQHVRPVATMQSQRMHKRHEAVKVVDQHRFGRYDDDNPSSNQVIPVWPF